MKLSRIALVVALLGLASLASAGPCTAIPYNCNTTSVVPSPIFGTNDGAAATLWGPAAFNAGLSSIVAPLILFSGGLADPTYLDGYDPTQYGLPNGSTSLPLAAINNISNGDQFAFLVNQLFDPNPLASGGDSIDNFVVPNIPNLSDALTSGTGTYFYETYGPSSGYGLMTDYFELDVTLAATPANSYAQSDPNYDPGTPAGVFRIGFGMNVNDCFDSVCTPYGGTATVTAVLLPGLQDQSVDSGDFVVLGNLTGCTGGEGSCVGQLLYTDAEFDAFPTTTPEPTTLLLLGSGLLGLARRFRR